MMVKQYSPQISRKEKFPDEYCIPSEGRYGCGKVFMKSIEIRENA